MNNLFRKLLTLLAAAFVFVPFLSGCDSGADDYKDMVIFEKIKGDGSGYFGDYGFKTSIDSIKDGSFDISEYICKRKYHFDPTVSWAIEDEESDSPKYSYYDLNIDDLNNEVLKIVDKYKPNYYGGYGFVFSLEPIQMPVVFEAPDAVIEKPAETKTYYESYYNIFNFNRAPQSGKYKPEYTASIENFNFNFKPSTPVHRLGYTFDGWELKEGQDLDFSSELKPITYVAKWKAPTHTITYKNVEAEDNPNPLKYTRGDSFELKPLDIPGVVFKGWVYNDEYITRIDESFSGDITISADLEYTTYNAKYYVDGELLTTKYFDYNSKNYELPEVPHKQGYVGSWDKVKIDEMKNYEINAVYKPVDIFVRPKTNLEGVEISSINLKSNNLVKDLIDSYKSKTYAIKGVYSDEKYEHKLDLNYEIRETTTLYFDLEAYTHISNYNHYIEATNHPEKAYILDSDISFDGNKINTFDNFSGVFNGNGHTISNFKIEPNNLNSAGITLFGNNSGTIKNLNLSNVTLSYDYASDASRDYSLGLLTTTNTGMINNVSINNYEVLNTVNIHVTNDEVNVNVKAGLLATVNKGNIISSGFTHSYYTINMSMGNGVINMGNKTTANYNLSLGTLVGVNEGTIDHGFVNDGSFEFMSQLTKLEDGGSWSYMNINGNAGGLVGENKGSINSSHIKSIFTYWAKTCEDNGSFFYDVSAWGLNDKVVIDNANNVGGLVGKNSGTIDKSYTEHGLPTFTVSKASALQFKQTSYFGGLVGYNSGNISRSLADTLNGNVTGNGTSERNTLYVGGFVGKSIDKAIINNCLSDGSFTLNGNGLKSAGFVGNNAGTVATSASQTTINNTDDNNAYAGFVYRNEETGYLRRNVGVPRLLGSVLYYHDFGYVNALGFSYRNYYVQTSTSATNMGYFDNTIGDISGEVVKATRIEGLGFDMSIWSIDEGSFVLGVK